MKPRCAHREFLPRVNFTGDAVRNRSVAGSCEGAKPLLFRGLILLLYLVCLLSMNVRPASAAEGAGRFTRVEGKADILKNGALPAIPAKVGDAITVKDVVRTKSDSSAEITFNDGNILKVSQRSRIDISEYVSEDAQGKRVITLPRGKVEAIVPAKLDKQMSSSKASRFEIHTPNAVAGVRGTCLSVSHQGNATWVFSIDKPDCEDPGIVFVYNIFDPRASRDVPPGYNTFVAGKLVPRAPKPTTKDDLRRSTSGSGGVETGPLGNIAVINSIIENGNVINPPSNPPSTPPPTPITTKQGDFERLE